jgi:hypothetical protein
MKTAVYSWRIDPERKAALEDEARQRGESLADLLDRITQEWLTTERASGDPDDAREARVRERALRACGTISGSDPSRASRVREEVRRRLESRRGRAR